MTDDFTSREHIPDRHRKLNAGAEDLATQFQRLHSSQRDRAAAASPLGRALIESTRASTYDRIAPLVARIDPTWEPRPDETIPTRPPWNSAPACGIDLDAPASTDGDNRNKIVTLIVKTTNAIRHPRRRRTG